MNITESKAVFDLLEGLTGRDSDPYEALEALVLLVERAQKALGAGPNPEAVLTRLSQSASTVESAGQIFFPLVDAAGYMADELVVDRKLAEASK